MLRRDTHSRVQDAALLASAGVLHHDVLLHYDARSTNKGKQCGLCGLHQPKPCCCLSRSWGRGKSVQLA